MADTSPPEYHEYLPLFRQVNADQLPPHRPSNPQIALQEGFTPLVVTVVIESESWCRIRVAPGTDDGYVLCKVQVRERSRFGRFGFGFPRAAITCATVGLNLTSTYITKRLSEEEREIISIEGGQPSLYTLRVGGLLATDTLSFWRLLAESTFFINPPLAPLSFYCLVPTPATFYRLLPPSTVSCRLLPPSVLCAPATCDSRLLPLLPPSAL